MSGEESKPGSNSVGQSHVKSSSSSARDLKTTWADAKRPFTNGVNITNQLIADDSFEQLSSKMLPVLFTNLTKAHNGYWDTMSDDDAIVRSESYNFSEQES